MSTKRVLIIDDEPDICELIEITLNRMGLDTLSRVNYTSAISTLESEAFDMCLTDMNLPDGDGIDIVAWVQENRPELPIAVFTAHGNMESAVKALKAGAFDFVSKPVDLQLLRNLVTSAVTLTGEDKQSTAPSRRTSICGESPAVKALLEKVNKLARSQAPVFIHGESGTGKERVARLIHDLGPRTEHKFVPVNCGAIPAELMESEFFGHLKGSFTGAASDKDGLFHAADGGTLFLDEVAELPLHMQVKLLRAIQEKAVRPVGAHHETSVDVRILSASHKNLAEQVKVGTFREDLFYRINVIELDVPSLRKRVQDIPALATVLLETLAEKTHLVSIPKLSPDAMRALLKYNYPGNVRELENILERALAMAENNVINREDLHLQSIQKTEAELGAPAVDTSDKEQILHALEETRWNKTAAAKLLGMTRRQLHYRLAKLGID